MTLQNALLSGDPATLISAIDLLPHSPDGDGTTHTMRAACWLGASLLSAPSTVTVGHMLPSSPGSARGLYRRCIEECNSAIRCRPGDLAAHILSGASASRHIASPRSPTLPCLAVANALSMMGKFRRARAACARGIEQAVQGGLPDPILFSMLVHMANGLARDIDMAPTGTIPAPLSCARSGRPGREGAFALGPLCPAARAELALSSACTTSAADVRGASGDDERTGTGSTPCRKRRLPNASAAPAPAPPAPPTPVRPRPPVPSSPLVAGGRGEHAQRSSRLQPPDVDAATRARIVTPSAARLARAAQSRSSQLLDAAYNRQIRIAVGLVNASRLDTALPLLDRLTREHPAFVDAWIVRGSVHALGGRVKAAHSDFDTALEINPISVEALRRRAEVRASLYVAAAHTRAPCRSNSARAHGDGAGLTLDGRDDYYGSAADLTAALRVCGGDGGGKEEAALVRKRATLHTRFGNHPAVRGRACWWCHRLISSHVTRVWRRRRTTWIGCSVPAAAGKAAPPTSTDSLPPRCSTRA